MLPKPRINFLRERIQTADSDFFDVDWLKQANSNSQTPLVIIQHGLEGSSNSSYVHRLTEALFALGYDIAAVNFRGCSGEHNRQAHSYNAGFYQDLAQLLKRERSLRCDSDIHMIGISLGAAAILSMAVNLPDKPYTKLALISVPLDLAKGLAHMEKGFSKIYDNYFTKSLKFKFDDKFTVRDDSPLGDRKAKTVASLRDFDNVVTAPLSGYQDGQDYYQQNRPLDRLKALTHVHKSIGIFMSADDPLVNPEAVEELRTLAKDYFDVYFYDKGGHVGFVSGIIPKLAKQWVIPDVVTWLESAEEEPNDNSA